MQNFTGAIIKRRVCNGKLVGAEIWRPQCKPVILDVQGIQDLRVYLKNQNQKLDNAYIKSDGRIVAFQHKKVETVEVHSGSTTNSKSAVTVAPKPSLQLSVTAGQKEVHIFTLSKYMNKCGILSNDTWFDKVRTDRDFLRKYERTIYAVDRATIKDYKNLTIVTPFGITDITKLSTGCKTLLNILYLIEKGNGKPMLVNITEAGDAVTDRIFEVVAGTNIYLYLRRSVCPANMNLSYKINGVAVSDEFEFIKAIVLD